MTKNIEKLSMTYMRYGLMVTVALALIGLMVMQVWYLDLLTPIIVSVAFSLVMLALAVMFVYYLVDTQDSMLRFFMVFIVFYFGMLIHHSIFFARINNR